MREITEIIIHCSATKERSNFKLNDIEGWHKQRGFPLSGGTYCGYHYVIGLDGTIEVGKDIKAIGCHCKGHNANSIGICYIGGLDLWGKPKNTMTPFQIDAMLKLVNFLQWMYPKAKVYGHNEFANKDCPCFNVHEFLGFC